MRGGCEWALGARAGSVEAGEEQVRAWLGLGRRSGRRHAARRLGGFVKPKWNINGVQGRAGTRWALSFSRFHPFKMTPAWAVGEPNPAPPRRIQSPESSSPRPQRPASLRQSP